MEAVELVVAVAKADINGNFPVIVGLLLNSDDPSVIRIAKASSPMFDEYNRIVFKQYVLPNEFIDIEKADEIVTAIPKETLSQYSTLLYSTDHPICVKHKEFWDLTVPEYVGQEHEEV